MNRWHLVLGGAIAGALLVSTSPQEVNAEDGEPQGRGSKQEATSPIPRRKELPHSAKTVREWLAQVREAEVQNSVRVLDVRVTPTGNELEITLETENGKPLLIDATQFRTEGNSLVADIPNAVLALPDGQEFSTDNPTEGITSVRVTQINPSNIRVTVTGNNALPTQEVTLRTGDLVYSLKPEGDAPDEEIVVTGERQRGYFVPDATTGSRTDTPIRDLPFSVQVVPLELLQDRQVQRVNEALRTIAGVTPGQSSQSAFEEYTIRGFSSGFSGGNILRNGLRDATNTSGIALPNIEQIEVLKGPAGALFSQGSPGGTVNIITKKPLANARYSLEGLIGNFDTYRGSLDFTGPLNDAKTLLYRLTAGAYSSGTFIDFFDRRNYAIAPVLTWQIGEATKLTFEGEYTISQQPNDRGLPAKGTVLPNVNGTLPRNRFIGEPDDQLDKNDRYALRLGYTLEHQFSPDLKLRNTFRATRLRTPQNSLFPQALLDDERTLERELVVADDQFQDNYTLDTNIVGTFKTGTIAHKVLFGVDLNRNIYGGRGIQFALSPIDLFNPVYNQSEKTLIAEFPSEPITSDLLGIYLQDQIDLLPNLKLLLGGRFDIVSQKIDFADGSESFQQDEAFSPRIGLVYQPTDWLSFYASYSRSFLQNVGSTFERTLFKPERGTQYEVGVKADWLNRKLSTTLAFYQITRSNVLTSDPANPNFSIQTGEQRSRGIELDIAGEILPGWKIAGGYAYTNARITADTTFEVGNRLNNVPEHAFSLWTTYEVQTGSLKGIGGGLGLFYVGQREGDLGNTFQIPGYVRTDLSLFYRRDNLRIGLNIENLLDARYFEASESDLRVFYGAPFTVKGTISYSF
ncbi:TonB-dependent siderophore receptor [Leptothermofonsia sichuanensis E412]|uniref:TonB-dependent siderophore receptor n=1 Tax=Leptothermofonsia sichuanensis TaxID=2917832 RepID=UPI001CA60585|nr:TonB-dependent siderophore receptor [Leptothermofonsia sichuanensis]QZZ21399.1 TonB-dependent siderophore receptor [Leptothermofonsia sichuanensis E412]